MTHGTRVWEQRGRSLAANGAVMRTPVVGALFFDKPNVLYDVSIDLAAVTHADPRCLVSCTIVSALVAAVRVSSGARSTLANVSL